MYILTKSKSPIYLNHAHIVQHYPYPCIFLSKLTFLSYNILIHSFKSKNHATKFHCSLRKQLRPMLQTKFTSYCFLVFIFHRRLLFPLHISTQFIFSRCLSILDEPMLMHIIGSFYFFYSKIHSTSS